MGFPWSKKEESKKEEVIYHPPPQSYILSYSIPTWELKQDTKRQYREKTIEALKGRSSHKLRIGDLKLRQLLAKDLGLRSWRTPKQNPGERTIWINHTLAKGQFIAIIGIIQLSQNPKVSNIIIRVGSTGAVTLGLHEIDELYSILPIIKKLETYREDDELFSRFGKLEDIRMAAYFAEPYVFDGGTAIHITVESPEGNKTGDRLMLSGFVVEPVGMTII